MRVDLPPDRNGGRRIDYAYDGNGLRTAKRVNGRVAEAFRWLDPLRLEEFHDGREWWLFAYSEGRTPAGLTNGRDSYFLLCDQLGTPLALATVDGHVVQAMQYDSFGNLLSVRGNVVRLPLGFAGCLYDPDTGLTHFPWRDYDADTGRFTAVDPLGAKGGDRDWYGYCVDDPVNRVDVWGLFSLFGFDFGGDSQDKPSTGTGRDDNPYCKVHPCDDNGTMQGDYKPIDIHPGAEPFLLDNSFPLPDILTGMFRGEDGNPKEIRVPLGFDFVSPFRAYYERNKKP